MITFAANRRVHNQWQSSLPSRFIDELPSEHIDKISFRGGHPFIRKAPPPKMRALEEPIRALTEKTFKRDERVFHSKFGYGRVVSLDGDKLEIHFDHTGLKKVMKSFVEST